jgi:hypothetical protein
MKGDVKGYGNPRSKNSKGCYERCGKLTLTASTETEAAFLAMLAQVVFPLGEMEKRQPSTRLSLYRFLRRQVENKREFLKL